LSTNPIARYEMSRYRVDPNAPLPRYFQVYSSLTNRIQSGELSVGDALPSERQMVDEYGVSRITIVKAIDLLVREGLVERQHGRGNFVVDANSTPGTQSRRIIAFVSPFAPNDYFYPLTGVDQAARERGYKTLLCVSNQSIAEENRLLDELQKDGVDGIIIWSTINNDSPKRLFALAQSSAIPMVTLSYIHPELECDSVVCDNYAGSYAAIKHLIELGHQEIVYLSWSALDLFPVSERYRAYREAMRDAGLAPQEPWLFEDDIDRVNVDYVISPSGDNMASPELERIVQRLQATDSPTAIFAVNDNWGVLAAKAAEAAGLRVPEDLSIVGFGDEFVSAHLRVPMTTVSRNSVGLGRQATKLLIERIDGADGPARHEVLPADLIVRHTTAAPPEIRGMERE
jgi:DNA-binding LacI/PurR family transcriptional regulator